MEGFTHARAMRFGALAALAVSLSGCAAQQGAQPRLDKLTANPSAVIAAELAFARLAQEKGQWTAFRETAVRDAVMFVPQRIKAHDWLKGRADPPQAVRWQPHDVYVSCDGSAGATTGAWQDPANRTHGFFTTVWVRMNNGSYKWVLNHGEPLAKARVAPEMIRARTASCTGTPGVAITAMDAGSDHQVSVARDQTLQWASTVRPDGSRTVRISLWDGTALVPMIVDDVPAPKPAKATP